MVEPTVGFPKKVLLKAKEEIDNIGLGGVWNTPRDGPKAKMCCYKL